MASDGKTRQQSNLNWLYTVIYCSKYFIVFWFTVFVCFIICFTMFLLFKKKNPWYRPQCQNSKQLRWFPDSQAKAFGLASGWSGSCRLSLSQGASENSNWRVETRVETRVIKHPNHCNQTILDFVMFFFYFGELIISACGGSCAIRWRHGPWSFERRINCCAWRTRPGAVVRKKPTRDVVTTTRTTTTTTTRIMPMRLWERTGLAGFVKMQMPHVRQVYRSCSRRYKL